MHHIVGSGSQVVAFL